MSSVNLPKIKSQRKAIPDASEMLVSKYGFTLEQSREISKALGSSAARFGKMVIPLKMSGFTKDEMLEVIAVLGNGALEMTTWKNIKGIKNYTDSCETALLAYDAGLSLEEVQKMNPQSLSPENLRVMKTLRTI